MIIPTYNVEEYIDDCLTSLLGQSLKDIEIICVDDMSTDTTPDIIKYYQRKDKRIKYYPLKEKQGSGGCRNYALTKARGKYIQYVDSDDFLDLNALKELYEIAEREKTQILMYKATSYNHNENKFFIENYYDMKELSHHLNKLMGIKEYDSDIFRTAVVPWNKLYLKSFLTSLNVKFPEHLIHQDNPFFFETTLNADRIFFIEKYYNRRRRNNSITELKNQMELGTIDIIEFRGLDI
ncbi:glycosyltransferase family 2 protein [Methanosphaera sp. ISO3-F5]|uniref:glycosyltransferase family 2 protein n=1 Tax=Methanosphaera sp. ISO3-F5 TaxID=1452353 RepID=UPI002B25E2C0|nr:glycosyltransferase family 2 protein [Methanosphaera sp. ISO3-F5]WQH63428.1 glycosyltransferase family 2 protein [Methanosphaera sp. ISO3-F5]